MTGSDTGTFVISLDTELAWGTFDTKKGYNALETAYRRTPNIVRELCSFFETYEISATWAVVAHLFKDCCGRHDLPEVKLDWIDDWYGSLPCLNGMDTDLWHAPEVLEAIQSCSISQEVGLHGYSHLILGADGCSREVAEQEVKAAIDVLNSHDISPSSFVFPRNKIGHLDVLADAGIEVVRGHDRVWFEERELPRSVRKPFRFVNEALSWTPPVTTPREQSGLVEIPGSQAFRPFHDGWQFSPKQTRVKRAKKGLDAAAKTGKIFHLRFHPFDFGFEPDRMLGLLEQVLEYASMLRDRGCINVRPMREVARRYLANL
jgi:peptidoglycan/xylan/chitin deacetylase (PgdA/CDA1 family)